MAFLVSIRLKPTHCPPHTHPVFFADRVAHPPSLSRKSGDRAAAWGGLRKASAFSGGGADTGVVLDFTYDYDVDGQDVELTWSAAFSDTNLADHRIKTFTDSGCLANEDDHGQTGSTSADDQGIIDDLPRRLDFYAEVTAFDLAGNYTSVCSTDTIIITIPVPLALTNQHGCAIIEDKLQCWGDNQYGQLNQKLYKLKNGVCRIEPGYAQ